MALPSKEEQVLLEQFRASVADILTDEEVNDDLFLIRWIRAIFLVLARDHDLVKAEDMLRTVVKWRKENGLDEDAIVRKQKMDLSFFQEHFRYCLDGMDKKGRPVMSVLFGTWDVRKVVKAGRSPEFVAYLTECFEEVMQAIKQSARMHPPATGEPPITQMNLIYDWDGFAWGQLFSYQTVQNFLQIGSLYEAYYPEILHKCYFINCPRLISTVLGLLKPILAPKTMAKIQCFGTDKEAWTQELLGLIDAEHLGPPFGGTKTDNKNPFY